MPVNPGVAVLRLLRARAREDDAVEHPALARLTHVLVGGLRVASFHGGATPVQVDADADLGDDVDLVTQGEETLLGLLFRHVLVAVLDDQGRPTPVPAHDLLE